MTSHAEVKAALADPNHRIPPFADQPGGIGWLRGHVARFTDGPDHTRRRALITAELDRIDPDQLRHEAAQLARAGADQIAVRVLAKALGCTDLDAVVRAVVTVSAAYFPGTSAPGADEAVDELAAMLGPGSAEEVAGRISLLVQSCAATQALIDITEPGGPWPVESVLAETLRWNPPIRAIRRAKGGKTVVLDIAKANRDQAVFDSPDDFDPTRDASAHLTFGSGPHACPGARHAMAVAGGVLETR